MIHIEMPVTYEWRADGWYYSEDLCRTWHRGVDHKRKEPQ